MPGAKDKLEEIEREAKANATRAAAERAKREKAENARKAALPKCPTCGESLENHYVNNYWGSRYYCTSFKENGCTFDDGDLRNPYRP